MGTVTVLREALDAFNQADATPRLRQEQLTIKLDPKKENEMRARRRFSRR